MPVCDFDQVTCGDETSLFFGENRVKALGGARASAVQKCRGLPACEICMAGCGSSCSAALADCSLSLTDFSTPVE